MGQLLSMCSESKIDMAAGYAFDHYDKNESGTLTSNELRPAVAMVSTLIKHEIPASVIDMAIGECDIDGDQELDRDEFLHFVDKAVALAGITDDDVDEVIDPNREQDDAPADQ
mmetsp:Transcript_29265/g.51217  ORF Transcript_29265/g.51217 Transcript_29265/m.51217 type:complete len:113 (-) Transcript_29265:132-470(-)